MKKMKPVYGRRGGSRFRTAFMIRHGGLEETCGGGFLPRMRIEEKKKKTLGVGRKKGGKEVRLLPKGEKNGNLLNRAELKG